MDTSLPDGYYTRPVSMEDVQKIAALVDAQTRWLNGLDSSWEDELRSQWGWEFFHLDTDTQAVFSSDGQAVGYVEIWDIRAPHVDLIGYAVVHPEHMGCGIGTFLADWLEDRARRNIVKAPARARVTLRQAIQSTHMEAIDLLTKRGYFNHRDSYWMRIDFDQPPTIPTIPDGITIRAIAGEEDHRLALFAQYEAFRDHYGAVEETFEAFYKRLKDMIASETDHDPTLWFLAVEGDQPVGMAWCNSSAEDDPDMGWINTLGVRRQWRKHGVGLALLQYAFYELYARGKRYAGLAVDASSLTGATRLYERAGMRVDRVIHRFELVLRDGKILSRQSLE